MKTVLFVSVIILLTVVPAVAEETHSGHDTDGDHAVSGHHAFRHEIALFVGGTDEHGHDTELSLGLEYAYALSPRWSVGVGLEHVGGDLRNYIVTIPFRFKPVGGLFLTAAPGVEYHDGRDSGGGCGCEHDVHRASAEPGEPDTDETYFLFRLGVGYAFHIGESFGIYPTVNLDLVNGEEVWVYGVALGVMF